MKFVAISFVLFALQLMGPTSILASELPVDDHTIYVHLNPEQHQIEGESFIRFDSTSLNSLQFYTHPKMEILSVTTGVQYHLVEKSQRLHKYSLQLPQGVTELRIRFRTQIYDDPSDGESEGLIGTEGVVLFTSNFWTPLFAERLLRFDLKVEISQPNWEVISQGQRVTSVRQANKSHFHWSSSMPQDDIYLIAGPFKKYVLNQQGIEASVFLQSEDSVLADKFLNTTHSYIQTFQQLIGAYPYSKFSVIENLWETGYGMPSFTLLGPTVMRFPFILYSSFPHEILHNWWGNGVFVDYERGNWCEGLTTYMSDHYLQEMSGRGALYRQTALQNYRNYVEEKTEFPLRKFTGRHGAASQAIGYGKSMMFFHMLKVQFGEQKFYQALQTFYRERLFKRSTYEDIQSAFESVLGQNMQEMFFQWVDRIGAPEIEIVKAEKTIDKKKSQVQLTLRQNQKGEPYSLSVPVQILNKEGDVLVEQLLELKDRKQSWVLETPERAQKIIVDPHFDIFRKAAVDEFSPSMSGIFGEKNPLYIILPRKSPLAKAYQKWAQVVAANQSGGANIVWDNQIVELPQETSLWILGKNNLWVARAQALLKSYGVSFINDEVHVPNTEVFNLRRHSLAFIVRHPKSKEHFAGWMSAPDEKILLRMAEKLPHYGKYGGLVFLGEQNIFKKQWPVLNSPLHREL